MTLMIITLTLSQQHYFRSGLSAKLTAHGVQPHKATNVVVKIHVPIFIAVPANYHLKELITEGEA